MSGPDTLEPAPPRRWSRGRVVLVAVVGVMVLMWVYVLYLAFGPGRQPPPDRLDDPTFAVAAQSACDAALGDVASLPPAVETPDALERAAVVQQANQRFGEMLDELDRLVPDGEDGVIVREWLADWRTYLGDRQDYAAALRTDPAARLLVTPKANAQITEYLDAFASDNHMPACGTPLDVS
jgi:hypothetical protein